MTKYTLTYHRILIVLHMHYQILCVFSISEKKIKAEKKSRTKVLSELFHRTYFYTRIVLKY